MHRTNLKYCPVLIAICVVLLLSTGALHAQTSTAWGYSTGYGNVYGTFGLAQTMQTMYNTTRRHTQSTSSPATRSSTPTTLPAQAPPPRVVRNQGLFRPDRTLDTGKAFADGLGETAEEKALILKIFGGTKTAYEKEAASNGWKNNIAGGLTFFAVAAMTVYHDSEEPNDDAVKKYYEAVNASLDEMAGLESVSNKDKQNFNNMLIGFGGLLLAGYTEGKQTQNADTLARYKKLAGMLINMVMKTDPENLQMVDGQIVLK